MNHLLNGVVRAVAESFVLPEPIIEIGSYQVAGQEEIINLRTLFAGRRYLGVDMRPGPGVDLVGDVERLPLADASVGTVVSISTFEHVPRFWRGFEEVARVLRPHGALLVACPFFFYIHNYPADYWRFTPQAIDLLLEDYPQRLLGWHGTPKRPESVWSLAYKSADGALTPERFEAYRRRLDEYAREPLRSWRLMRYRLAQLVVGRGPFAVYLDRNRIETELRGTATPPPPRTPATPG